MIVSAVFVSIRIFARLKVFKRLWVDDGFVIFALILALASAILWQIFANDMFELMAVSSGHKIPTSTFIDNSERYSKASVAVIAFFYSTLWAIKISFLVFFKRLAKNVRRRQLLWWPIFGFAVATYFVCIGTIQYRCLTVPLQRIMTECTQNAAVSFQQITLKLNCVWDVLTDFLSLKSFCAVAGFN